MLIQSEVDRILELSQIQDRTPEEDVEYRSLREKFAGGIELVNPETYVRV